MKYVIKLAKVFQCAWGGSHDQNVEQQRLHNQSLSSADVTKPDHPFLFAHGCRWRWDKVIIRQLAWPCIGLVFDVKSRKQSPKGVLKRLVCIHAWTGQLLDMFFFSCEATVINKWHAGKKTWPENPASRSKHHRGSAVCSSPRSCWRLLLLSHPFIRSPFQVYPKLLHDFLFLVCQIQPSSFLHLSSLPPSSLPLFLSLSLPPSLSLSLSLPLLPSLSQSGGSPGERWPFSCSKQSQTHGDVWKSECFKTVAWMSCKANMLVSFSSNPHVWLSSYMLCTTVSAECLKWKNKGVFARVYAYHMPAACLRMCVWD